MLQSFLPVLFTGLAIAALHASIPTHWLPFVLVARAQGWSRSRALAVTALAGGGHVVMTTALGFGIAWLGVKADARWTEAFPWIAGSVLVATGLFYLFRHALGQHVHAHQCECGETNMAVSHKKDWAAISGLFAMLAFSPCETFLPIYLSSVKFGWSGFILLSVVLAVGTWSAMMLFTWLTLRGFAHFRFTFFEKYEHAVFGSMLCVLGVLVVVVERFGH